MRTRAWSAVGVALLTTLSTSGCSGSADATAVDDPGSGETKTQLEVFSWWVQPGEIEALQALFDLYREDNPGQRIFNAAEKTGPTAKQVLGERLDAGDPPDLFQQNAYEMRAFLQAHPGSIIPLDDLFESEGLTQVIAPEVLDNVTVDGAIYSVPVNAHRENSLFYNMDLFKASGLEAPQTLDDFLNACETLKADGITPIAVSTSQSWIVTKLFINLAMGSMGGAAFHDYFGAGKPLDEAALGDAIDVLDTVLANYVDLERAASEGFGWTQCAEAVHNGEAAMFLHGDWAKGYFVQLGWTPDVDFGVVGSPSAADVFLYGTDVFGIPAGAKHEAAARAFVKTIASQPGQVAFNTLKGSSPIRLDVPTKQFDSMAKEVIGDFRNAKLRMALKWQGAWDDAIGEFAKTRDKEALLQAFRDNPPE
jgi:glucose/mannose transport system substrate-binding protein